MYLHALHDACILPGATILLLLLLFIIILLLLVVIRSIEKIIGLQFSLCRFCTSCGGAQLNICKRVACYVGQQ